MAVKQTRARWTISLLIPCVLAAASLLGCPPPKPYDDAGRADLPVTADRGGDRTGAGDLAADTGADAALPDSVTIPDWKAMGDGGGCKHPPVKKACKDGFCAVEPGCFIMGSPKTEPCREPETAKETQHPVTLSHRFELGQHEVTQAEYKALMGSDPSEDLTCGTDCPVDNVTWEMAAAYCTALSKKQKLTPCYTCSGTGPYTTCGYTKYAKEKIYTCKGYRLPTEAEWEYAYRAGTTTAFYNGPVKDTACSGVDANASAIGWYKANAKLSKHSVGKKLPNALGLYDLPGNLAEWCHGHYAADLGSVAQKDPWGAAGGYPRVVRGGDWRLSPALALRAAFRWAEHSGKSGDFIGFRCARTIP